MEGVRTKEEVQELIRELERTNQRIKSNRNKWVDKQVPLDMIRENNYRIHTLEWVLGKHDRYD